MPVLVDDKAKSLLRAVPYFFSGFGRQRLGRRRARGGGTPLLGRGDHFFRGGACRGTALGRRGVGQSLPPVRRGPEHVLTTLRPGDSCNEVPVVDGGPNPANFAALENSTVWVISEESLSRLLGA